MQLKYGGRTLLERALGAVADARRVAVVGPRRAGDSQARMPERVVEVVYVSEVVTHGGPAAAIAAGFGALDLADGDRAEWIIVLPADLICPEAAAALLYDAALHASALVDAVVGERAGHAQHLAVAYRPVALEGAIARWGGEFGLAGRPARVLHEPLRKLFLNLPAGACVDIDSPDDALAHGLHLPPAASTELEPVI
ncbi:NTP transferase domain-containing protein [Gryllotalpicola reticulitermitis]|uniref:NTP transferase domain-containing protein n=1 Tax=Gryllotalpicola reticulitermitis TaxID=1184153 RepID=A0ABV8Q982_9MICO